MSTRLQSSRSPMWECYILKSNKKIFTPAREIIPAPAMLDIDDFLGLNDDEIFKSSFKFTEMHLMLTAIMPKPVVISSGNSTSWTWSFTPNNLVKPEYLFGEYLFGGTRLLPWYE